MLDENDIKIIRELQTDLPLDPRPYRVLAEQAEMNESEFLQRLRSLQERGLVRKIGASLRHREAGFKANAMIVWRVPEEKVDEVGDRLAGFSEVTHCYGRPTYPDWPYNLFTMVHAPAKEDCLNIACRLAAAVGLERKDYDLLFSEKELKKSSPVYFQEGGGTQLGQKVGEPVPGGPGGPSGWSQQPGPGL